MTVTQSPLLLVIAFWWAKQSMVIGLVFSKTMSEPLSGFLKLKESCKSAIICQNLSKSSTSQIVNYFIDAVEADSNSKFIVKSLCESSFQLFKASHIQDIYVKLEFKTVIIVAVCLPEMQKHRIYKLMMRLLATYSLQTVVVLQGKGLTQALSMLHLYVMHWKSLCGF